MTAGEGESHMPVRRKTRDEEEEEECTGDMSARGEQDDCFTDPLSDLTDTASTGYTFLSPISSHHTEN
jgi:hypothetical protein